MSDGRSILKSTNEITVEPIPIQWNQNLPVFAEEDFLKAVGEEYGWLGGIDKEASLRCFLPYTIVRKAGLRLVRFRTETIPCGVALEVGLEKCFLNEVVHYFQRSRADVIIPATNNAVFRTYPDRSQSVPYGSYVIELQQPEEVLWKNIGRITRQNIRTAQKDGVTIRDGMECLDPAYDLIRETFERSGMEFMHRDSFHRFARGLGRHGRLMVAEYRGVAHSYCLFGFSNRCVYAIYAGTIHQQHQGAIKLLYWEAMQQFRSLGVQKFDFLGARINPPKGSKQEAINLMKQRFGATLSEGYLWKCALRPWRASVYSVGVRVMRGGDIVDQEYARFNENPVKE